MLIAIPVISPVEVQLSAAHVARLLPSGQLGIVDVDYTVHDVQPELDPAKYALDEIEQAAYISEYHDSEWWRERIAMLRKRLREG